MAAMQRTAWLFPGQGSQKVGMGADLYAALPEARRLFEEADEILGFPLSRYCFEGPEEKLRQTDVTQPALFVHSLAVLRSLGWEPGEGIAVAGHSLGEWTAVVAAGALDFADGLRLVRRRGELMAAAGRERPGTMAAILGLDLETLKRLCAEAEGTVVVANINSPAQLVVSGETDAVGRVMEAAKAAGARRVVPLPVGGAFHSPLMEPAAQGLKEALGRVTLRPARVPVVANVTGRFVREPEEIRKALEEQLLGAVQWEATVRTLLEWGAERFVEIGPGRVLSGLVRQVSREVPTVTVGTLEEVQRLREEGAHGGGGAAQDG
jgi:[acyl-carrier-protein] S-malonyltransferase